MNLGLVCPYQLPRPGGVRSHIVGLGLALQGRGHQVTVIAPSEPAGLEGLSFLRCGSSRPLRFGGTQIDITWASRAELRAARRFDVLHFHTIWNPLMPIQLALGARCARVATFHDVSGPDTPRLARAVVPLAARAVQRLLVEELIAVSPAVTHHLPHPHVVIPNGLTVPELPSEPQRRDHLLFLGRLEPRKGLEVLLRALGRVRQSGGEVPPLRVAGDGPLREPMQRLALELGLSRVEWLGQVSEGDKWRELRRARYFVAPALGGESFGIVLLEAMAAGAPPLAAANEGYAAVLAAQPELLAPPGDVAALSALITRLWNDEASRLRLKNWGEQAWQRYNWSTLAGEVEAVYERALRARPAPPP